MPMGQLRQGIQVYEQRGLSMITCSIVPNRVVSSPKGRSSKLMLLIPIHTLVRSKLAPM